MNRSFPFNQFKDNPEIVFYLKAGHACLSAYNADKDKRKSKPSVLAFTPIRRSEHAYVILKNSNEGKQSRLFRFSQPLPDQIANQLIKSFPN